MTCKDAKDIFIEDYHNFLFNGFKTSHKRKLSIKKGYQSEFFDGDKILTATKSPDYIIFLWKTEERQIVILRVVEVHKLTMEVLEKKNSFEKFWQNKFHCNIPDICSDYRFCLLKVGSHKNPRAEGQFRLHGIKVARYYELP